MPFLNQVDKPKKASILSVEFKKTKNGDDGVFIKTSDYSVFLWGQSKKAIALKTILETYLLSDKSFELICVPDKKDKDGFTLAKGNPCKWFHSEGLFSTQNETEIEINLDDFF